MQEAAVVLSVLRERGSKGLPLTQLYRQMFNKNLYLLAYGNIYSNQGAMTPGASEETAHDALLPGGACRPAACPAHAALTPVTAHLPSRGTERHLGGGIVVCALRGAPPGWSRPRCPPA
jgi:hypothetical protein